MSFGKRKQDPFILGLIEEVKNHECLWNVNRKDFYSRGVMARAWTDIAIMLERKVPFIRAKWKNLKDTYRKEVKKNVVDGEYQGIWLYFDKLDFLRDMMDIGDKNDSESIEDNNIDDSQSLPDDEPTVESPTNDSLRGNNSPPPAKRKRDEYGTNTMFIPSNDVTTSLLGKNINPKTDAIEEEEKYDEQFLISLLPFLRKLDPIRKLIVRSKIQAAVVEELTQSYLDPIGH